MLSIQWNGENESKHYSREKKKKKKSGPQACREMELWGSKKINTVNNVMLALENEERDLNAL